MSQEKIFRNEFFDFSQFVSISIFFLVKFSRCKRVQSITFYCLIDESPAITAVIEIRLNISKPNLRKQRFSQSNPLTMACEVRIASSRWKTIGMRSFARLLINSGIQSLDKRRDSIRSVRSFIMRLIGSALFVYHRNIY